MFVSSLKRIYCFNFFWLFILVLPVLYPYYASLGISLEQFFQLQAVFGLSVALFDIPTGYFADLYGRKISLCIGSLLSALGYLLLYFATDFWSLLAHEITVGIALSFISGSDVALLYDSLPMDQRHHQGATRALGYSQWFYSLGESVAALICGWLVSYSFHAIVLAQMILSWIPLIIALTLNEPNIQRKEKSRWSHIPEICKKLFADTVIMRYLSVNFVAWFLANFIIIWSVQKYWQHLQIDLKYFGVLWAFYNISIGIAAIAVPYLQGRLGIKAMTISVPLLCIIGYFLMSQNQLILGLIGGFFIYFSRGVNNVTLRDQINIRLNADLRATANSILSFIFRFIFAVVGPMIGYYMDLRGIHETFIILSIIFAGIFLVITPPLLKLESTQNPT